MMKKTLPWEPPYDLVMQSASSRWNRALDVDKGAQHLANYLGSCVGDMAYVAQSLGKTSVSALDRSDLVALDPAVADQCGVRLGWRPRSERLSFEANLAAAARRATSPTGTAPKAVPVHKREKLAVK